MPRIYHPEGEKPPRLPALVFVFGSNLEGHHQSGAARIARDDFQAERGVGKGRTNMAYGIPVKSQNQTLPLDAIAQGVSEFLSYADANPSLTFYVVRAGCGVAGYADAQVAPLFVGASANCIFSEKWKPWLD